uniref:DNA-directed RNA polymerase n=1 Tax=Salmo trutta TaxID=8032 RepID=A0A673XN10_SALTR
MHVIPQMLLHVCFLLYHNASILSLPFFFPVLEARIQQLQYDIVLDVQHARIQFVNAPKSGREASSGKSHKNVSGVRTEVPKVRQNISKGGGQTSKGGGKDASASKSRWMEKLILEKKTKTQKLNLKLGIEDKPCALLPGGLCVLWRHRPSPAPPAHSPPHDKPTQPAQHRTLQRHDEGLGQEGKCCSLLYYNSRILKHFIDLCRHSALPPYSPCGQLQGSLNQIGRLFILVEEAGLKPNLTSYCAALECMGRTPNCSPKVINRVLRQIKEDGLCVEELFRLCVFRQDERDMLLRAIHTVEPDFQPSINAVLHTYDPNNVDICHCQSLSNLPPSGESLHILAKELGNRVHNKFCIRMKSHNQMVGKLSHIYNEYAELLEFDVLPRERWWKVEAEHSSGPSLLGDNTQWPHTVVMELGTYLVDLMVKHMKVNSDILSPAYDRKFIPVLYHMYTFRSNKQVGFIKPHPILTQMQQDAMETTLTFDSYVMPMLCPPVPWTSAKFGAYLLTPTKMMRTVVGANQHEILLEKCQDADLHAVLDSLNQLGNAAWRINQPLLDIIISIFNDKGNEKLDVPPPNSEAPKILRYSQQDLATYSSAEKAHLKRELVKAKKKCSEMHSLRMDALYKLSIANHMRDEVFWFPHNMDFRGRTYPCPPYFNHLGSDVTRAILVFAEGKPLGPGGLKWLKIHLVNLTGLKKRSSLAGRLEYANTIMDDILDSADNPLNGKKWWQNADEPWQALACCMEIANAVRSPDPTHFISHFPVHQDGSCNGLQHYAALGRDVIGATSVNLIPCEVPQDVYSGVAQQVEEFRARDSEKGLKIAQVLEGFISRKVVKQTVMTVVYGVTRYGGRLQIEKRLKEVDDFPKEYIWDASHYLVQQVFSSLKEMFTGTREIQDWLTESARLIAKSGNTVEWVTPLGLPIIQPYHRTRTQMLKGTIQDLSLQITHDSKQKPDTVKQKNAFPPNFIHSLDSTHMMLTALYCYSAGLTFVSVHDCFWTHALTVDTMNKVCREQFVALHSQPILQELSNFLLQKYCSGLS